MNLYSIFKKFKINKLEAILLHNSSDLKNKKGLRLLNELNKLKKKIINKIGVSIYEINEYEF